MFLEDLVCMDQKLEEVLQEQATIKLILKRYLEI